MAINPPERFAAYLSRAKEMAAQETTSAAPRRSSGTPPEHITLADDGFHWPQYADHSHAFWYVEWWYFAFEDEAKGISGIAALGVFNPGNEEHLGAATCTLAVLDRESGETTTVMDLYDLKDFVASYSQADISVGTNTNKVVNRDHYTLCVESKDGKVALELDYHRAEGIGPHWMGYDITGTTRPWEISSWLAWMPSAKAKGKLRIGQHSIDIDGTGYHDHNFAVWLFPASTWQWAMFNDPEQGLAFDFASQESFQFSQAYFKHGDVELDFPDAEISPGEWKRWHLLWQYPTAANFSATATDAKGDTYRLVLEWQADQAAPLWKSPMIIFEQAARFTGTLYKDDPQRGWVPVQDYDIRGFYEYTAKWV